MCGVEIYRSSGVGASTQRAAIDILILWSKGMPFVYGVAFQMRSPRSPNSDSRMGLHLLRFSLLNLH